MAASRKRWAWWLGGALLISGLGAVGVRQLDGLLLGKAREQAARLGQRLGRPVEIGAVHARLFWGPGVRLEGIRVGPAPGESEALLDLPEVEARVALWPAVFSRGRDLSFPRVELRRPALHVIRLPGGATNLERVIQQLAPAPTGSAQPSSPAEGFQVRIDHAALHDGIIRLLDRSEQDARELAIQGIDVEMDGLRPGQRLEATLRAAVLTSAPNLEVKLVTAPLPASLRPAPEKLSLRLQPLDLSPLAPFLPRATGLQGGTLEADFQADLHATRIIGSVHARDLRFAEAPDPIDARLDADISGDLHRGDLRLGKLELALGPAQLSGQGEVKGLLTDAPQVAGLEITGKNLDPALIAQRYPPLRGALAGMAGPLGLTVQGIDDAGRPAIAVRVDASALRLELPGRLRKAAGAPLTASATLSGAARGALRFDGKADLSGVDLRPGGVLNKAPGQALSLSAVGGYLPSKIELSAFRITIKGDTLTGTARVEMSHGVAFAAALQSAQLDADALLLEPGAAPVKAPAASSGVGPVAHAAAPVPEQRGHLGLQIGALRFKRTDFQDVHAELEKTGEVLAVQRLTAGVHGGNVTLDGSELRLRAEGTPFRIQGKATGLEMSALLPRSVRPDLVTGKFTGEVALTGGGFEPRLLSRTLNGTLEGKVVDGAFRGGDIVAAVARPLGLTMESAGDKATSLGKELPFGLKLGGGVARLARPLTVQQESGALTLEGGIGLDGQLDLSGTLALAPRAIDALTHGRVSVQGPVPVGFKVTGPAWEPQVTSLDLRPAMRLLAQELLSPKAKESLKRLLGR